MLERFIDKTTFESQEDFIKNFKIFYYYSYTIITSLKIYWNMNCSFKSGYILAEF